MSSAPDKQEAYRRLVTDLVGSGLSVRDGAGSSIRLIWLSSTTRSKPQRSRELTLGCSMELTH